MKLSIIIVSYNTKELLRRCLESVIRCLVRGDSEEKKFTITKPLLPNTQIIVVDNGSTDGSIQLIKNEKELFLRNVKIKNYNLKLKIIENKKNLGFAKAVNQALREAKGEVVLLLNSDTQIKPEALEKLLEFEKKVRPAIIGAKLLNPDGSIQASVFNLPTMNRAVGEFWLGKKNAFSKYAPLGDKPVTVEAVVGGAMLISRKIVDKIGFFDERYFMYFEDLDYCRRARKAGFKVWYLPSAQITHEHGASGKEISSLTQRWLVQSSKIYHGLFKHYLISFILWLGQKLKKS